MSVTNLNVNLGVVRSMPPSYQFAFATGELKKSLVSLTRAKIPVSSDIAFIANVKHGKAAKRKK